MFLYTAHAVVGVRASSRITLTLVNSRRNDICVTRQKAACDSSRDSNQFAASRWCSCRSEANAIQTLASIKQIFDVGIGHRAKRTGVFGSYERQFDGMPRRPPASL